MFQGSLVKRLRRRPLTAETGVRFPYELLIEYQYEKSTEAIASVFLLYMKLRLEKGTKVYYNDLIRFHIYVWLIVILDGEKYDSF